METHKNSSRWQNLLFTKSVAFFYHFSVGGFSALLMNPHVNVRHPEVVSSAVPGTKRMLKSPSWTLEADVNLNPGPPTAAAAGHEAAVLDGFFRRMGVKEFPPHRPLQRIKQFLMHLKHLVQ